MSWVHKSSNQPTKSMRSASLTTAERILTLGHKSTLSSRTFSAAQPSSSAVSSSTASTESLAASVESSTSDQSSATPQPFSSQKLYLLLPNHKCPNKKNCPFHPPEEQEEELEEAEVTLVNKRRAMSLASHEVNMISEQLLAEKLAKINQQISSNLLEGNKLHLPRKTSHDITLPTADLDRLRFDHSNTPATGSTREHSVTSDYDLDSGVTFDSCSDRELDEDTLPLIQEEIFIPDLVLPVELKNHTEVQKQTTTTETETTIEITETSTVVSGTFTCEVASTTEEVEISTPVKIEEQLPEVHTKPSFTKELEYLTVTEGSLVRLECCVTGDPRPDIKWLKNSEPIDSIDGYKTQRSDDGTVALVIEGAEVKDSGSYTCVADNVAGSATTQAKIRVQKAAEEVPEPEVYQQPEKREAKKQRPVPPEFTAKLKNKTTEEGATVQLTCSVVGLPEPSCRWLKDGKEISDGSDFTLRNNGGLLSLKIAHAKQSMAGEYRVEASNSEGTTSCSCILQIEGDKEIEPLELDVVRPKFTRKIQDLHVRKGEDAIFTCTATGKPVPEFKWNRDMIDITASDSVVINSNSHGQAQLILKKVKPSDYGLYNCVAQSRAGRAKCSAYLHVTEKSTSPMKDLEFAIIQARKESSVERGNNLGSPPSLVLMLPDTLDIVVGGKLKLDSSVQGYPMPLVTWHKGDRGLMYSQRHRIVPCGTLHTMEIPQVMALDKGEYIVRATNIYGTVQSSCYVNILPKGSKVAASDYNREAVVVTTKENLIAPYFVKHLPKSIDALLGMNIRIDCILREGIELIKRSKSESTFQDLEKDKKEFIDEGFHGEFIPLEARSNDKSRYHSEDKKQSENIAKSTKQEEITSKPVSFTTTLKDLVQPTGSEVLFECSTSGVAEPEVKWYKDGKVLVPSNRTKVVTNGSKHTLRIADICSTDEGVYTCQLSHVSEDKSCRAVLTVTREVPEISHSKTQAAEQDQKPSTNKTIEQPAIEKTPEKPVKYEQPSFGQPLPTTTVANHGDNVELTCQLTSSDVTSIKWELDGRELPPDARYLITKDESSNQHKLTIHSATEKDSAKYTCVGYLKNGELIHTSTKLSVSAAKPPPEQKIEDFKPHFTTKLTDTAVKDGEGLVLECDIEGNPRPQILWLRDDVEVFDSPDFQISTIGSHCKLQVTEIYPEDEGKYSCRAVNALGDAVSTCYVSVEDTGGYLSADSASSTSSKSYDKNRPKRGETKEVEAEKNKSKKDQETLEQPPELVVKPRRQFIDEGGKAKFKSSFDGSKSTVLFWSKNKQVLEEGENIRMYEADGFHFLEVKKVSAEDVGMYSVTVQNSAGSDTAEAELEVFEKPKLLSKSGPEWEQALHNLTVEEDDPEVKLVCTCKDLNQPSVRWFHNGKEVFSGFHMKIQHVAQTATLTIKSIQEKDAGEFKCLMTGKNGELETSCILSVGNPEIMEPPVFEKELHDMEVDEGDKLELDVEVKGPAVARVNWYHNNVEIVHGNSHYLITSLGNRHTLTVLHATSESSGEYVCEAYNDIGSTDTYCFIEVRDVKRPEPPSFVVHPTSLSAHEGQTATFTCQVKGQPMPNVLWKKEGVALATDQKFKITRIIDCHTLNVNNLSYMDQGEYTCYVHNTQGDMSHICTLHVTGVQDDSWQSQTADLKNKSRFRQIELAQRMSQLDLLENAASKEHQLLPSGNVTEFNRKGMSRFGDVSNNVEILTSKISQRPSFDSTIGETENPTPNPQFVNLETRQNNQDGSHQTIGKNSNLSSELDPKRPVITTKYTIENPVNQRSILASNSHQHSTSNFQVTVNKFSHKPEETKNATNNAITDFRNVLKQRQVSPQQVNSQSNSTNFRRVMSPNKTNDFKGNTSAPQTINERKTSPNNQTYHCVTQTSESTRPHNFGSISMTDDATPSRSSALHSSAYEKRGQMLEDDMQIKKETTINNVKPTSIHQTINSSINENVSTTLPTESSNKVRQNWRTVNSQLPDKTPAVQDLNVTSSNLSMTHVTKDPKPVNIRAKGNSLAGSFGICDTSNVGHDTEGATIKLEGSEPLNKTGNTSLKNVIQAVDAEAYNRRGSANSKGISLDPSQVAFVNQQQVPDSHRVKQDKFSFEPGKLTLKHTQSKVNLSMLTACKVNICEFNPSEPQSEATTLEVTSVSASVPLRQSLTSPPFYPQHHSTNDLDQQRAQSSDIKLEDNNEVFSDTSAKKGSTYQQFNPNSENTKQNLRSFGSNFTWEKTPDDVTETRKGILSKKSSEQDNFNQSKTTTDNQLTQMNTRLSEKPPYYKNVGHQENMKLTNRFSTFSTSETGSDNVPQESNSSPKAADKIIDDFRKVKLKSAAGIAKDKFDLAKSKFMSKSTESIFTDVKLKPVSKPKDNYNKSEISSNAERIRASSKSIDFSKVSSTSPLKISANYSPISKTNITHGNITPKISDRVKTFNSDTKPSLQSSGYLNPTESSRIRTSYVKNEKVLPGGITKTNSNRKSKGVGAKFEAATKDSKASKEEMHYMPRHIARSKQVDPKADKEQMPYTSLHIARSKQVDPKADKEQMPYTSLHIVSSKQVDIKTPIQHNFTENNSGKTSGSYQSFQVSETAISKDGSQKNENTANKPNTIDSAMDSSSENYQEKVTDWIKKRQSVQIDSFPTLTSGGNKLREAGRFSLFEPDSSKKLEGDRQTTETNSLIKASRTFVPNSSRDEQHLKTEMPNRKFVNDTEIRIKARTRRANLKEYNGIESPPHDSVKADVKQGIEYSEISNTDVKHAYNDQKPADEGSRDSTKLRSDGDFSRLNRTSFQMSSNNLEVSPESSPKQSELHDNDKPNSSNMIVPGRAYASKELTSVSEREPQMFTTSITMTPEVEKEKLTSSIILTKSMKDSTIPGVLPSSEAVNYIQSSSLTFESNKSSATVAPRTSTTPPPTNAVALIVPTSLKRPGAAEQHHPEGSAVEYRTHSSGVVFGHLKQDSQTTKPAAQAIHVQSSPGQGPRESQTESQSAHSGNSRDSWVKPSRPRHANIYPVIDNEPSPYKEPLKLLTDDSESVLSMASISSSSSDASNVTVDSGYTKNYFRRHVGNEMNHLVSEFLHPESIGSWDQISYTRDRDDTEISGAKLDLFEPTNVNQNTDSSCQDNGLNRNNEENMRLTANLQYMTSKHKEESTVEYGDQPTMNNFKQLRSQLGDPSQTHMGNSVGFLKDADSISTMKENQTINAATESSEPVYISRRQRRLLEKTSNNSNDSGLKPEDGDTLSKSYLPEVITSQTIFREPEDKESSLFYENPPLGTHISRTESGDLGHNFAMREAKSDSTRWGSRMSTELDRPKSKFGLENIKQEKNTYKTKTETPQSDKPNEGIKENVGFKQRDIFSMGKRSSIDDSRDVFYRTGAETEHSTAKLAANAVSDNTSGNQRKSFFDKDSGHNLGFSQDNYLANQNQRSFIDKDLTKDERHSSGQFRINSLERTAVSSTSNYQNETPLSTSQTDFTPQNRPAISIMSSSALPTFSAQQPSWLETENRLENCPPSFPVPLHDVSVTLGARAVLLCQVTGNPLPEVKWLLNLKQIEPSEGIEITATEGTSRLTLTHVTSEHAGDYTCWARNVLGTVSSHCTLSLEECHPPTVPGSNNSYGIPEAIAKTDFGNMSAHLPDSSETEPASFDIGEHDELPIPPRAVVINTNDKFEDIYEVDKEVGRGKFGVVYKCKHKKDNTIWAAKFIKCREKAKLELRKEIEIMNKLRHPKLLLLWDAFETPRQVIMVMEYISAGELFERVIADDYYLTENDCIHFTRQICEGVGYMHSNGIIHLDLKPENILCVSKNSNRIKIIDFGLAHFYTPGQSIRVLFGTPEFVAPEVINYDEISFQTDIWSLGVICYVLLSGLSPFLGDNETETLANVTNGEYDFDDEDFDEISDLAKDFIGKLLIKKKEERLLTDECLDHPWLNQDEVDGPLAKRLNTEKLKRFMVRRKWLKTGNAVKAVSRLLKSNSLTGFNSLDRGFSSDSGPDTPFNNRTISTLQTTAEIHGDEDDDGDSDESNFVFDQVTPGTSNTLGFAPQNSPEASSSRREESFSSTSNQESYSKVDALSTCKNTTRNDTLPISSDKNNAHLIPQGISEESVESVSRKLETKYSNASRSSRIVPKETGRNENAEKLFDLTSTSAPKERASSLQINNKQTEATHLPKQSGNDTVYQVPCFTKSMTRCKTCAGDVARFAVIVTGSLPLHVTWLLEGEEIHPDNRHTLSSNENTGTFSLTIRNVEEDDEGEYTCKAVNSHGECACSAELAVLLL